MPLHTFRSAFSVVLALVSSMGCNADPTEPVEEPLEDADLRVLFIGNSLTYTNDLPALVQTIAETAGHTMTRGVVALPNVSLEDHWRMGVEQTINSAKADVVVMQQGPSSLPANQEYLKTWTEILAPVIRAAGGEPALYMVWPEATRSHAFEAVFDAYKGAAEGVNGLFIPAGHAWRHAWAINPGLRLYGPDRFHPSQLGSAVAALTIFRVLFDEDVTDLPARMVPTTAGLPTIDLGIHAETVLFAVENAVESSAEGDPAGMF